MSALFLHVGLCAFDPFLIRPSHSLIIIDHAAHLFFYLLCAFHLSSGYRSAIKIDTLGGTEYRGSNNATVCPVNTRSWPPGETATLI